MPSLFDLIVQSFCSSSFTDTRIFLFQLCFESIERLLAARHENHVAALFGPAEAPVINASDGMIGEGGKGGYLEGPLL